MKAAELLHPDDGAERILSVVASATRLEVDQGKAWYHNANQVCCDLADRFDISVERAACIVAVLSPATAWERNKHDAEMLCTHYFAGRSTAPNTSGYRKNTEKAWSIISMPWGMDSGLAEQFTNTLQVQRWSETQPRRWATVTIGAKWSIWDFVGGPKVTAFAQLLADPDGSDAVCIDRHAIRAYQGGYEADSDHGEVNISRSMYNKVAQGYRIAAPMKGWKASTMQAVAWVTMRRLLGETPDGKA